jgi:hypothetical protein
LLVLRSQLVDDAQKTQPFLMAVPVVVHRDDTTVKRVEGGEQGRGSVPFVVMGHRAADGQHPDSGDRTLLEIGSSLRASRATRQAVTVAFVNPAGRGTSVNQAMNSSNPRLYTRCVNRRRNAVEHQRLQSIHEHLRQPEFAPIGCGAAKI